MSYTNADGLRVITNDDQGVVKTQGIAGGAMHQTLVMDLTLTSVGTTFTSTNIDLMNPYIPAGSLILSATLVMTTAATSGGAATLSIGTYNAAGTAIVAAGIDSAIAVAAIDGVGETVRCDGTHLTTAGYIAENAYIGAIYATAAWTAGVGKLYIEYVKL
jgi:hypothetical protein